MKESQSLTPDRILPYLIHQMIPVMRDIAPRHAGRRFWCSVLRTLCAADSSQCCSSVLSRQHLKTDAATITKLDIQMSAGNPFIFGSKVKVTTSLSVYRQNTILPLCTYRVFPAVMPCCTSHASNTRFFLCPSRLLAGCICKPCWIFPGLGFCNFIFAGFF